MSMAIRILMVAAMALMSLLVVTPAMAQFEGAKESSEQVIYFNESKQQGIVVQITHLDEAAPGMSYADMAPVIFDDAFVEENMVGFTVVQSGELDDEQLNTMGVDAGKLFEVVDQDTMQEALMLVMVDDNDLIMLAYIGLRSDTDFEVAVQFGIDVVDDGIDVDPPAGFVEIDQ